VDTGMGLERTICVLTGKKTVYETDAFTGIIAKIAELSGKEYGQDEGVTKAFRVVADHLRTSTFILGDDRGVSPSNTDQGYILRRLIRRAVRYGMSLGMAEGFTAEIANVIIDQYKAVYPELERNAAFVTEQLKLEEGRFARTLKQGEKEFDKVYTNTVNTRALLESILNAGDRVATARELAQTKKLRPSPDMMPIIEAANAGDEAALIAALNARMASLNVLDGRSAFKLYDTFGFPIEMTIELAAEKGLTVDEADFAERFRKHQELSHQGAEQKFKGGLADHSEQTAKLHTATHLLHAALRKVLGDEVAQKGSNITAERLRFDFSFGRKMTREELDEVERLVNVAIQAKVPVVCEEMTVPEAKAKGAIGLFESKYGEKVRTYKMGEYSFEICGGPHAVNTGDLGSFKIQKEESSSAGVRRIKAVIQG
ncbi:MAG: alanine--tRNA ligase-related protein, partial [Aristaeellaceae bacterium]